MNKSPALIRNVVAGSGAGIGTGVIPLTILSVSSAQDELMPNVNSPPNVILIAVNISPALSGSVHGLTSTALLIVMPPKGNTPRIPLKLPGVDGRESLSNNATAEPVRSMPTETMRLKKITDGSVFVSVQVAENVSPA